MSTVFEAIERKPDRKIRVGDIDENGDRVVWVRADNADQVRRFLASLDVYPTRVTALEPGLCESPADGLDYDLTTTHTDRAVNKPDHACFRRFEMILRNGELIMKCKQCGALYEDPAPRGGYYSAGESPTDYRSSGPERRDH